MMDLPFTMTGKVVHGQSLGNTYESPTANITPNEDISSLPRGVYYSTVSVEGHTYPAITNLGVRPTVSNDGRLNAETFIFDYDKDLYGKDIAVTLLAFRRGEQKFGSVDMLYETIRTDISEAAKYHGITL